MTPATILCRMPGVNTSRASEGDFAPFGHTKCFAYADDHLTARARGGALTSSSHRDSVASFGQPTRPAAAHPNLALTGGIGDILDPSCAAHARERTADAAHTGARRTAQAAQTRARPVASPALPRDRHLEFLPVARGAGAVRHNGGAARSPGRVLRRTCSVGRPRRPESTCTSCARRQST